jgi:hypothetical protein
MHNDPFCEALQKAINLAPNPTTAAQLQAWMDKHCRKVIVTGGGVHTNTGGVPTTPPKNPAD